MRPMGFGRWQGMVRTHLRLKADRISGRNKLWHLYLSISRLYLVSRTDKVAPGSVEYQINFSHLLHDPRLRVVHEL